MKNLSARFLAFIPLLVFPTLLFAQEPISFRPDITIKKIMTVQDNCIRIARDLNTETLYYALDSGSIYRPNLLTKTRRLVARSTHHGVTSLAGFAIAPDGTFFVLGNQKNDGKNMGVLMKGVGDDNGREWTKVMETVEYPLNGHFDHNWNAIAFSPDGHYIFLNNGSRTDHGESQDMDGVREFPLTSAIFRIPIDAENLVLQNDADSLEAQGYLYADGVRNHFDLAFAPNGDLFGVENSGDRDDPEELNWIREGEHYGFPWRMGTNDTPQQFPGYDFTADPFVNPGAYAVMLGFFHDDSTYPAPPEGVVFADPVRSVGPDADKYRDPADGQIKDASDEGVTISTFTAHRSPLGLLFDTEMNLPRDLKGGGFVLSWTPGSSSLLSPFGDESEDLLHLDLTKIEAENRYEARVTRIVGNFKNPVDAVLAENKMYVIENGRSSSLWEVTFEEEISAPFPIGGDPRVKPEEFEITTYAADLNFPIGMVELSDGSILTAVSNGTSFWSSPSGSFVQLIDADDNGVAETRNVLLDDVPVGGLTALRMVDDLVFTTGQGKPIVIYRYSPENEPSFEKVGQFDFSYPSSWLHPHSALAVRKTPGETDSYDLFFPIGSAKNFENTTGTVSISSEIGGNGTLNGDAVHMIQIIKQDDQIGATAPVQIATGLRSASGLAFHPVTGDLYFEDNGIDGLVDPNEPTSADEINFIAKDDIGGEIEDFGFPDNYTAYRTGEVVGGGGIQPLVAFQPWTDPMTGAEAEGPNEIAFAPPEFPDGLNNGIFVGFHGKFFLAGLENEENPLVFVDGETWEYFHFIDNMQPDIGHLDGLLASGADLFVADFSSHGNLNADAANSGKIYRIRYTSMATSVADGSETVLPSGYALSNAWPNPFNPSTKIQYVLPKNSDVTLKIFDTLGREVRTLVQASQATGVYTVTWNGKTETGATAPSGLYFYRLQAGDFTQAKRVLLMK